MTATLEGVSTKIDAVPVVMLNFNVGSRDLLPAWVTPVDERRPQAQSKKPSGRMLFRSPSADLLHFLPDLERRGFVPVRLVVISRHNLMWRMALVYVDKARLREGDKRLPSHDMGYIQNLVCHYFWPIRVYRNPGENGGNFVVEAGNARPNNASSRSLADLRIDFDADALELVSGEDRE